VRVLVASRNADKIREIEEALGEGSWEVVGADDWEEDLPEIEETGDTFLENATLKACQVARAAGAWTLADDSGLCVEALDGGPGPRSARYAGDGCTYVDNCVKLLGALEGLPPVQREAHFACVIALADPTGRLRGAFEAQCAGSINGLPTGQGGFGYDPVFVPTDGDGRTFAEMDSHEKHAISHRGRALALFSREAHAILESGS
jgi:XTP/dITP diphosphohydrolase